MESRNLNTKDQMEEESQIEQRKTDHIQLAFESNVDHKSIDNRFVYERMLSAHANKNQTLQATVGNKNLNYPLWVSSMTGGTAMALKINDQLAKVCNDFGLGMGLGSCRQLLDSDERLGDFDIRDKIGDQPLYANLGIAQIETLIEENSTDKIDALVEKLRADGLIVHINPLQEWMQPEGDRINQPPIDTIEKLIGLTSVPLMVKEVGQGMGKESLRRLLALPLVAVDFAANGGTNFSKLELFRADDLRKEVFASVVNLGHGADQMVDWCNELYGEMKDERKCNQLIISGGLKTFLDGYYYIKKSKIPAIYGQASGFLKYAILDYEKLQEYVELQVEGLLMANAYLKINK